MDGRDELLDEVAALALGTLGAEEARKVRMQIALDETLMAEYRALRPVADLVGYSVEADPSTMDELQRVRLKSRVMKAVRSDLARPVAMPQARAGNTWPAYAVTAAALVAAFVATLDNVAIRKDLSTQQREVAALQQRVENQGALADAARRQVADLFAPDGKHYAVKGGEVVERDGRIYIAMRTLPKLPPGKVFQIWTLARGAKAVAPSITFTPNAVGSAVVRVPAQTRPVAAVAISIEPAGGSKAPTSTPTFIRPLG